MNVCCSMKLEQADRRPSWSVIVALEQTNLIASQNILQCESK